MPRKLITLMLAPLALAACIDTPDPGSISQGARAFGEDCAACHGLDAMGAGSFGGNLIVTPPDLTLLSHRNDGVFPANHVMSTIDGHIRGAHFSAAMPEFGAGDMGEVIHVEQDGIATPIPARLLALSRYLESIQR